MRVMNSKRRDPLIKFDMLLCRRVLPTVQPGYVRQMIPGAAPEKGEPWEDIFQDIERVIMPGVRLTVTTAPYKSNKVFIIVKCVGDSLAFSAFPRVLPDRQFVARYSCRHVE